MNQLFAYATYLQARINRAESPEDLAKLNLMLDEAVEAMTADVDGEVPA
jgi:hypothetical protein